MSRFENLPKEEVAKKVKQWLTEEGHSVNEYKDDSTDFSFSIGQDNRAVNIGFHKTSKDSLIVLGKLHLQPQEQSMFRHTKTKREMIYDFQLLFTQMNLDSIFTMNNTQEQFTIEDIVLQKTVYFDGLTKDKLFDVMSAIFNCLKLLQLKFELLGQQRQ